MLVTDLFQHQYQSEKYEWEESFHMNGLVALLRYIYFWCFIFTYPSLPSIPSVYVEGVRSVPGAILLI